MVPFRVWIVFMGMTGQSSLRSISDKFHLRLSAAWCCELGRAWILHRWTLHLDQPVAFTSAFAHDCLCVFAMPVCIANAHEMCLRQRVRTLAFASCGAWLLKGALISDPLFLVSIWARERMPVVSNRVLRRVCATAHTLQSRSTCWIHFQASRPCHMAQLGFPGDPCRGPGRRRHGRSGRRGGARAGRSTPARRWRATWFSWTAIIYIVKVSTLVAKQSRTLGSLAWDSQFESQYFVQF